MLKKLILGVIISVSLSGFVFYGISAFYPKPKASAEVSVDKAPEVCTVWARNVFFIALPIGLLILYLGFMVIPYPTIRNSFLGGGILTIIIGAAHYWVCLGAMMKFIILGATLAVVIWAAHKRLGEKPRKSRS